VLTKIEKCLPTVSSVEELDKSSVVDCLTLVCDFTLHYFSTLGSSLRLHSAKSLTMELFRLDVWYDLDVTRLRSAWQQGLKVACHGSDVELSQYLEQLLSVVVDCVSGTDDVSQVYRLSEIVSRLWHTTSHSLDLTILHEALRSSISVLLGSAWLLAPVLDRALFVHSLEGFDVTTAVGGVSGTRAISLAALTARFLLTTWKAGRSSWTEDKTSCDTAADAAPDEGDDEADNVDVDNTEPACSDENDDLTVDNSDAQEDVDSLFLEMLLDISQTVVCIDASEAYGSKHRLLQQELKQDFCNLIGQLNDTEAELVIGRVLERSMTNGEAWCLVLDVVLCQLESCGKEVVVQRCLPTDAEPFLPLTLSTASTLSVILVRMNRDTRLQIAELMVALMLSSSADDIAVFDSKYVLVIIFTYHISKMTSQNIFL